MINEKRKQPWWTPIALVLLSPVIFGLLLLVIPLALCYFIYGALLHALIWVWWNSQGRDILFVYSDSPIWQEYVENHFLPLLSSRAVILNWSDRKRWHFSLSTLAFRYFGGQEEFNPMAIVFRPMRSARVFRFWKPFKDFKHGNPEALKEIEKDFFQLIGAPYQPAA